MIDLICLPYAGGGANVFRPWEKEASRMGVRMHAVCPPGRETRFNETPFREMDPMLDWLEATLPDALRRPYALFGHSLGGCVAYALARRRFLEGRSLPVCLFVSATLPAWRERPHPLHRLDEAGMREQLRTYDPHRFPFDQHPELWETFLPVLRADFRLVETYSPPEEGRTLPVPLVVLSGCQDPIASPSAMSEWRQATDASFDQILIDDGHFFIRDKPLAVLNAVEKGMRKVLDGSAVVAKAL
ncbi:thioesterase II family protein [Imhoffiella purpurea]|nr:alpha/beta fold hydrolase [Imhoffiella purpurea]